MFQLFLLFLFLQLSKFIISVPTIFPATEKDENDPCIDHNGVQGKCVLITSCPALSKCLHQDDQRPTICSWDRLHPIVCCPSYNPRVESPDIPNTTELNEVTGTDLDEIVTTSEPLTTVTVTIELESTSPELNGKIDCGVALNVPAIAIVGGDEVRTPYEWPWMAALFTNSENDKPLLNENNQFCGGTIISDNYILTAAHCLDKFMGTRVSDLFVGIGSNDLETTIKLPIRKIIIHPNYVSTKSYYDIALLITSTLINFTDTIRPICLPEPSLTNLLTNNDQSDFNNIEVAGWGKLEYQGRSSSKLRKAYLRIVPNQQCNQSYSDLKIPAISEGIKVNQICAGTREGDVDSCQGDSGGPLTIGQIKQDRFVNYQIGVVSFGRGCANPDYPGVYTRLIDYVPWIEEQLKTLT